MTNEGKILKLLLLQQVLTVRVGHLVLSVLYCALSLALKEDKRDKEFKKIADDWQKAVHDLGEETKKILEASSE